MNQIYKILTFIFIGFTIVLSIGLIFTGTGNRGLNREIKEIKNNIRVSELKVDSLSNVIAQRNVLDSVRSIKLDSLKSKLESINNKRIITTYETYNTITHLNLSGDISFLAGFVDSAAISR